MLGATGCGGPHKEPAPAPSQPLTPPIAGEGGGAAIAPEGGTSPSADAVELKAGAVADAGPPDAAPAPEAAPAPDAAPPAKRPRGGEGRPRGRGFIVA
jgi:2-oxoglutarate dehydrogenase E2 component (dihydrolipoamide succinyltransferase)